MDEIEPPKRGGLRERNKRDKLARIIAAARDGFGRNGFEGTTLRQVAEAAEVGTGTLFQYAKTKEDLLVLVFKGELEPVIEQSFLNVPEGNLLDQLLGVFGAVTEHHSKNIILSRPFLKDLAFVTPSLGMEVTEFNNRWLSSLVQLIESAKSRGEIRPEIDSQLLATCSRQLYIGSLRLWVAGKYNREHLDYHVPRALALLLTGLGPDRESSPLA